VVTDASGAIAVYEFNITVGSPDIVFVVDYDPVNQPEFRGASIEENGSVLDAMVTLGDNKHDQWETTVVATVTVGAANGLLGSTPLEFTEVGVMDNESAFYSVTDTGNGTLSVDEDAVSVDPRSADEEWLTGSPPPVEVVVQFPENSAGAFEVELALEGSDRHRLYAHTSGHRQQRDCGKRLGGHTRRGAGRALRARFGGGRRGGDTPRWGSRDARYRVDRGGGVGRRRHRVQHPLGGASLVLVEGPSGHRGEQTDRPGWRPADAVGCKPVAQFGTPGCRIVPRRYSRQYDRGCER
jgi:hypothetical protein